MDQGNATGSPTAEKVTPAPKRPRDPTFDPIYIRDISERVYRIRLEQDCPGNVARMIGKDDDGGKMLRSRAGHLDSLTRV